jgi:hypothetical protein
LAVIRELGRLKGRSSHQGLPFSVSEIQEVRDLLEGINFREARYGLAGDEELSWQGSASTSVFGFLSQGSTHLRS